MRQLLRITLSGVGYDVRTACDGQDALATLGEAKPDLIITDLNMPNMDGFAFIKAVRAYPGVSRKPIFILSTEDDADKQAHAADIGATGWIVKPFVADSLIRLANRLAPIR